MLHRAIEESLPGDLLNHDLVEGNNFELLCKNHANYETVHQQISAVLVDISETEVTHRVRKC